MLFLWLKAFHLMAVVCWFAGLFYLPRLFVYHAMSEDQTSRERFRVMERKLYRGIMTPAAIATVVFGLWMLHINPALLSTGWIKLKLALVMALIVYHGVCGYFLRRFSADNNTRSHVFFRVFNELPVIALIAIILLAVLKPF